MLKEVPEGSLCVDLGLRAILADDVRTSGLSRYEIAGRMGRALSTEVTKFQLDAWTAESKEGHRFPLAYTPAWCWAVGSTRIVDHLAQVLGLRVLTDLDAARAEVQAEREELRQRQTELRRREAALSGKKE